MTTPHANPAGARSLLRRVVRFSLPHAAPPSAHPLPKSPNTFAGSPAFSGWARYFEAEIECVGIVDASLGYLVDIKDADRAVHAAVVPALARAIADGAPAPGEALPAIANALADELARTLPPRAAAALSALRLRLTPYHSLEYRMDLPRRVLIRQQFDFAASHRLHCPSLSDEENRRLFGKCNHPSGHGHNYRLEPCVAVALDPSGRQGFSLEHLEHVTDRIIIQKFDHKHLNLDTTEFGPFGVNPSVENIAAVFYGLLAPHISAASPDATLRSVTVWETDRTSSTFPA